MFAYSTITAPRRKRIPIPLGPFCRRAFRPAFSATAEFQRTGWEEQPSFSPSLYLSTLPDAPGYWGLRSHSHPPALPPILAFSLRMLTPTAFWHHLERSGFVISFTKLDVLQIFVVLMATPCCIRRAGPSQCEVLQWLTCSLQRSISHSSSLTSGGALVIISISSLADSDSASLAFTTPCRASRPRVSSASKMVFSIFLLFFSSSSLIFKARADLYTTSPNMRPFASR